MPEMTFVARWSDGSVEAYYSPSLVVRDYLEPGVSYAPAEFVARACVALKIASDRVLAKFGYACPRAAATCARIEAKARALAGVPDAAVEVVAHESSAFP